MYYILVMTTKGAVLVSQCRRERRVRGLEAVRDGTGSQTSDEVCGTPDERAGVQIPRRHSNQGDGVREKPNQMRGEILKITRTQQYIDSQPMPMQLGANPKSKGKGKESKGKGKGKGKDVKGKDKAKDAENESSNKAKSDDQRKCVYCQKMGHVKAECRKRLKDFADGEGKPVAASPHPHDTAAVVPLECLLPGERHSSTFVIAMPCENSEMSCEFSSEQAVRSPLRSGGHV